MCCSDCFSAASWKRPFRSQRLGPFQLRFFQILSGCCFLSGGVTNQQDLRGSFKWWGSCQGRSSVSDRSSIKGTVFESLFEQQRALKVKQMSSDQQQTSKALFFAGVYNLPHWVSLNALRGRKYNLFFRTFCVLCSFGCVENKNQEIC